MICLIMPNITQAERASRLATWTVQRQCSYSIAPDHLNWEGDSRKRRNLSEAVHDGLAVGDEITGLG
ncbi:unnamed protein product [Cylicostephanus goldi]|uniref:Uncharacterized protein n=1 Tax=Cylicostephanus goldi TaxID=71465 RepID=A0A3P6T356_CYLGO|nr:unnamed protein product [Cylicostephanus goldi]